MITTRIASAIAAGALALGLFTGAAATFIVRDATAPQADFHSIMSEHMFSQGMGSMMSGSMMGPDSSFGPGMMDVPGASTMPGNQHEQHHPVDWK